MYMNFELTEFNIHLGLLENSAMVSVGLIDEYLKKMPIIIPANNETASAKKKFNVKCIADLITVHSADSVTHR